MENDRVCCISFNTNSKSQFKISKVYHYLKTGKRIYNTNHNHNHHHHIFISTDACYLNRYIASFASAMHKMNKIVHGMPHLGSFYSLSLVNNIGCGSTMVQCNAMLRETRMILWLCIKPTEPQFNSYESFWVIEETVRRKLKP